MESSRKHRSSSNSSTKDGKRRKREDVDDLKEVVEKESIYDDNLNNNELDSEKKMLPQYVYDDDPEDASGRFSREADKKLEELRTWLKGSSSVKNEADVKEMLEFKKPKKNKWLRKRDKLDVDAMDAEAIDDLGSRNHPPTRRPPKETSEADKTNNAYQAAKAKAEEASRPLRIGKKEDGYFAVDYQNWLDRALLKQNHKQASGPEVIPLIAASNTEEDYPKSGQPLENTVVITEMQEFVQRLDIDEEHCFIPRSFREENTSGWADAQDSEKLLLAGQIHEAPVGKGMAGALKLLKDRGALKKQTVIPPKQAFRLFCHKFHGIGPGKMLSFQCE